MTTDSASPSADAAKEVDSVNVADAAKEVNPPSADSLKVDPPQSGPSKGLITGIGVVATLGLVAGIVALALTVTKGETSANPGAAPVTVTVTAQPSQAIDAGDVTPTAAAEPTQPGLTAALLDVPGVIIGPEGAALAELPTGPKVRVDLFSDYMCPYCGQFELTYGPTLQELANAGTISLVVHPVSILDRFSSGTNYSTRSAGAAMALASLEPKAFGDFNTKLFEQQPEENSEGLTDEQIAAIAVEAGADAKTAEALAAAADATVIAALTAAAGEAGMTGTPTLAFTGADGQPVRWDYQTPIEQVVQQLAGQ